jgi:hypothetical protein
MQGRVTDGLRALLGASEEEKESRGTRVCSVGSDWGSNQIAQARTAPSVALRQT